MSGKSTVVPTRSFAKIVGASLVGTTIEFYDFFLYTSAAAIVFNKVFFPTSDPLTGTLLSLLTYAIGFVARPLGGLVFGHFGDRIGRKKLLIISLVLMGGSSTLMGVLPTYAAVGVTAPILLTVLRLIQGFALGGEWGGAVLLVSEHGSAERRGFWASWPQCGAPAGNLIATGVLALLAAVQSDAAFIAWGWRVAFLLSAVLVAIGLWVRLSVSESPVFLAAQQAQEPAPKLPIAHVLRTSWRSVLVAMGARMAENVSYYVLTAFILVYVVNTLHLSKSWGLQAVVIGSAVHFVTIPLWGMLSDRVGRRAVYLFGAVAMAAWAFGFFAMLDTKSYGSIVLGTTIGLVLHGAMYGPQAAYFAELFDTRGRYSGASIGAQLASVAAGGVAPLIATALLKAYGSTTPISLYVVGMCAITVVAVLLSRETRGAELTDPSPAAPAEAKAEAVVA